MVDWESMELPVSTQAELLSLNRTGLYYQPVPPSAHEVACKHRIDEIYTARCYYGYRRIAAQLQREGQPINQKTVARYMQEMGLAAVYPGPSLSQAGTSGGNLSLFAGQCEGDDAQSYLGHRSHVYSPGVGSWMYLVAILDWYSRYVVSWELDQTMQIAFVIEAVQRALSQARPQIWNSDQGSQFTSPQYTQLLLSHDVRISMDGKGRALDNIFTERVRRCAYILLVGEVQHH
jgi:putative transposase